MERNGWKVITIRSRESEPSMMTPEIRCTNCRRPYPSEGLPFVCPTCGGIFDYSSGWKFDLKDVDETQAGIWRYRSSFGLPVGISPVSLGEGNTRLVWAKAFHRKIAFKCEYENPTGSFKDRGSTVIISWLRARGITEIVEDSSGNAGASLATYATAAGIKARIFLPATASGPKRQQIEATGAELVPIPGPRSQTSEAVRREAEKGAIYASHAYLPFNLPGYGTCAYEIYQQLGEKIPGTVIVPAGQGGLLLGIKRGFDALRIGLYEKMNDEQEKRSIRSPKMIGVQARACAPLWAMYLAGIEGMRFVTEGTTLAEGVKIKHPVRADAILDEIATEEERSGMSKVPALCVVDEEEILPGKKQLARLGFDVEPTSAIVWSALQQVVEIAPEPVVVILTGAGSKYE